MRIHEMTLPDPRKFVAALVGACLLAWAAAVGATPPAVPPGGAPAGSADSRQSEMGIGEWLTRMHQASRKRAYIGTFVVSTGSSMTSARIWHICDGVQQMERVEPLSGTPRSTFRRNDQVITFLPESRTAVLERREALGLFPQLLTAPDSAIAQHYTVKLSGTERVAGHDADVVMLLPRDNMRFGYRIWNEKKTGLVVKLQTLDTDGKVIEQVAFSELQMNAPVSMAKLTQMMNNTEGYRIERLEVEKTTANAEGWALRNPVAGFKSMSCHKRPGNPQEPASSDRILQWVFSDGLASVSLFVESFDRRRHVAEGVSSVGATHTLTRKLSDKAGEWWLTVVGEAPLQTLNVFSQGLERSK
jgi:sigma-E factor negative regulatory protein RseB